MSELKATSEHKAFIELHVSLQCGAAEPVLSHILDRWGEQQMEQIDELGRTPLHVALESPTHPRLVDIILERILKSNERASQQRDFLGRLPLHNALLHRADPRIIGALLRSNPSSGVEYTNMLDVRFIDKLPLEMAMDCRCDLSTLFMILLGDPSVVTNLDR